MPPSRDHQLEAAIIEDPADPASYLVYADHLQAAGDPRGELIAIQAARADHDTAELAAAEAALLEAHPLSLRGGLAETTAVDWFHGFWHRLYVAAQVDDPDDFIAQVVASPSARFLRELHGDGPFRPSVLAQLAPVAATLRELHLEGMPRGAFDDDDLRALAPLTRLRGLTLSACARITATGTAVLAALPALARLDLQGCTLTDAVAHTLADLPLVDVAFESVATFSDDGMRVLARAPLRRLSLGGRAIGDATIAPLDGHATLASLTLDGVALGAAGVRTLATLPRLRRLRLATGDIAGRDLAMLAPLADRLESLHLNGSPGVREPTCEVLSGFERLAFLDVSATKVSGAGLRALSRIRSLTQLDLSFLPIEDDDVAALAALPDLRGLSLTYTRISDRAIDTLVQLPRLEQLDLSNTRITAAAIDRLAALPALVELGLADCDDAVLDRAYARPEWHVSHDMLCLDDGLSAARSAPRS